MKDVDSLREKGQEQIRNETKKVMGKIKNRRFAIIYLLNVAYKKKKNLDFSKLIAFLEKHPSQFVIDGKAFRKVMTQELSIAFAAGIPFSLDGTEMKPLNGVSEAELNKGAPAELIEILKQYDH